MVRNWPEAGLVHGSQFVIGLSQEYADDDRLKLRNLGVNTAVEIDGAVYSSGGLGMSLDGTPLLAVGEAQKVMWELVQCRNDPSQWLAGLTGISKSAEWRPYLHLPVPGFVESAGFLTGSTFVPIGRLC